MRLKLDMLDIREVQFSQKTMVDNAVLFINRSELQELLLTDKRLSQVDIDLARPGEKVRILHVTEAVEPRAKGEGSGADFPGALGKQDRAGEGTTRVLRGAAVLMSEYVDGPEPPRDPNGEIVDMTGPGAEIGLYGKTQNIVLLPYPAAGVNRQDYRIAIKIAGLKAAVYLAKAGQDQKAGETVIYELPPLTKHGKNLETLPKIAYIFSVISTQHGIIAGEPVLYGNNVNRAIPTILHPNEVLDGALISPYRAWGMETYLIQNHPIIKELYQRHSQELCFVGVIMTIAFDNEAENGRAAVMVSNLAKWVLGADGAILTKSGGGAPELILARTAQKCEEVGIKTALALSHIPADIRDVSFGGLTLFNLPEVNAIVSMGTPWEKLVLPPVEKIIGNPVILPEEPPIDGEIVRMVRWIRGAQDQIGHVRLIAGQY
jgi:sarcosine reductase